MYRRVRIDWTGLLRLVHENLLKGACDSVHLTVKKRKFIPLKIPVLNPAQQRGESGLSGPNPITFVIVMWRLSSFFMVGRLKEVDTRTLSKGHLSTLTNYMSQNSSGA